MTVPDALQRCLSLAGWVYTAWMWAASGCKALVQYSSSVPFRMRAVPSGRKS